MAIDLADFARTHIAPRDLLASPSFPQDLWAEMARAGLFRIGLPAAHGGDGGGYAAIAAAERVLVEEGQSTGLAGVWGGHQMVARWFLAGFGDAAQQARYLPALASGALTAGVAISEPKVGAHPKHLTTRAEPVGAGWRISGEKSYVTNGDIAGLYVVLAITAMAGERKRYSFFLVERDAPGLQVIEAATPESMRPVGHVALRLEGVPVRGEALIGPRDGAYEAMALPFRDAEDAVGTSGMAGNLAGMLKLLAGELAPGEEAVADLGALAGLAALAGPSAAALARSVDEGSFTGPEAQALLIGLRQLAAEFHKRATALRDAHSATRSARLDARLHSIQTSLSVARGPRAIRMARLGAGLLAGGRDKAGPVV
jgi:acyl-CoA dehydrogenase